MLAGPILSVRQTSFGVKAGIKFRPRVSRGLKICQSCQRLVIHFGLDQAKIVNYN